jgi:hypothetical protein
MERKIKNIIKNPIFVFKENPVFAIILFYFKWMMNIHFFLNIFLFLIKSYCSEKVLSKHFK